MSIRCYTNCLTVLLLAVCMTPVKAAPAADRDIFVPTTISAEAQQLLKKLSVAKPYTRKAPPIGIGLGLR
jgi:hypothetical protein